MTFVIHLLKTSFALAVLPHFDALSTNAALRRVVATVLRLLQIGSVSWPGTTVLLVIAGLVWILAAPLLTIAWLDALAEPRSLQQHLRMAAANYPAAIGITLCCTCYLALAGAGSFGLAFAMHRALAFTHDTRLQDLACLLAAAPLAWLVLHAAALQDTALCALSLRGPGVRAAIALGLRAASAHTLLLRGGLSATELLATLAAGLLPRMFFGLGERASVTVLLISQATALCITLVRGYWLAWALRSVAVTNAAAQA